MSNAYRFVGVENAGKLPLNGDVYILDLYTSDYNGGIIASIKVYAGPDTIGGKYPSWEAFKADWEIA